MKLYILPKIIAIVGPTASGKTNLAIKLAKKFGGEIVSADSRQIYRGMDIGTAKAPISYARRSRASTKSSVPSNDGIQIYSSGIRHHLISVRNPNQLYTVAQYKRDAIKAIQQILKKGKLPFLVGGTGLYISAVLDNLQIPKVRPKPRLRARFEKLIAKRGLKFLYKKLLKLDPEAAYIVDPKNPRRVIRALEVAMTTGKPFTDQRQKGSKLFDSLILGLNPSKTKLKKNIERRTKLMIKNGLVHEVKTLLATFNFQLSTFNSIGYREIIDHLQGKTDLKQALLLINRHNLQYAKRQMTWFRKMPVVWILNEKQAEREIGGFLNEPVA